MSPFQTAFVLDAAISSHGSSLTFAAVGAEEKVLHGARRRAHAAQVGGLQEVVVGVRCAHDRVVGEQALLTSSSETSQR